MGSYSERIFLALILCLCSCEERTSGGDLKLLCDGSEDIKMLFVFGLGAFKPGDTFTPEDEVMLYENGGFLYIKGNCEFWASEASSDPMEGDRIGSLSEREAADIVAGLKYSQWDDLQGQYIGGQVSHGGNAYLFADDIELYCQGECTESDEVPEKIRTIFSNAWQWRRYLWEKGMKPSNTLRVTASKVSDPDTLIQHHSEYIFEWPLDWALGSIASSDLDFGGAGRSVLVEELEELVKIRELWTRYQESDYHLIGILVREGNDIFRVFVRDALPYEDEHGLAPWSLAEPPA